MNFDTGIGDSPIEQKLLREALEAGRGKVEGDVLVGVVAEEVERHIEAIVGSEHGFGPGFMLAVWGENKQPAYAANRPEEDLIEALTAMLRHLISKRSAGFPDIVIESPR